MTSNSIVSRLGKIPTASISDALDALGQAGSLHGIGPLDPASRIRAVGPAYTVRYEPITDEPGTVGDFLDDVEPGSVIIIDNQGRTDCTVWGGIMTRASAARGIAGTVVFGACRDTSTTLELGYPMWSVARFMRTGKDRVRLVEVQGTLHIDGVGIEPGDIVVADSDGVLVVASDKAAEVVALAEKIEQTESDIVDAVRSGSTLHEARRQFSYHTLQSAT
ncbi:diguanylate cyclase [Rhodococcus sp. 06-156-3C]|uniref:RraA family protein n=1 Tax=Nocardiaceae TaxID=85025 RepID=UPI000522F6CF|nr:MULTISPECIES: RraA family protein [Rhodococcus]OZD08722.1 diguanylate cyclase [Rhodococcus sp. 06-156-4C]OZD17300.1 diguanylate cyclase [Rhodococcus sp. 06-156-3C]OZD18637.1 diguanylate cyclase [Rhodococcus sp. 06-156-4a]OZD25044.1 diguanylate cyclase [Rhodococcus sp. 06-156-3b]OZD34202.1 diguanylate cyclase [Rhodococcus sp. 06-156-3]